MSYPERLISTEVKVNQIGQNVCPDCSLVRRTDLKSLRTNSGIIDPEIWQSNHLFDLSSNIFLCDEHGIECQIDDVKYIPDVDDPEFIGEIVTRSVDAETISYKIHSGLTVKFKKQLIENLSGKYSYKGNDSFEFLLQTEYRPTLLNSFHFQFFVLGNHEDGTPKRILKLPDVSFKRTLAKRIRNEIIEKELVQEVNIG